MLLENKTLVLFLSLQGSLTELNKKKCFVHKKAANTSVNTRNWCLILPCCEIRPYGLKVEKSLKNKRISEGFVR